MSSVRTRIAPSPTGFPHIGTMFQALVNYAVAKSARGQFIVRIEDTDRARFVEGAEKAIFDALDWFGLTPDESPIHGGPYKPYRQSERLDLYKKHALELINKGYAYYCFCSPERLETVRKQMQQEGKPPMYDGHCLQIDSKEAAKKAQTESHVIRMKIEKTGGPVVLHDRIRGDINFDRHTIDDQVILKSDGYPTYHLAVVVDDYYMKITHIIRGEEWISSAPKHVLLYQYLFPETNPPEITHTPLLRNPDRSKLSKRHGHASVSWYQEEGYLPEAILNFLATRVWNHPEGKEIFTLKEFIQKFRLQDMHIQGPIVDLDKLKWLNGQWIRQKTNEEVLALLEPYKPKDLDNKLLTHLIPLVRDRLEKLSEITPLTDYVVKEPAIDITTLLKESKHDRKQTAAYLENVKAALETISPWSVPAIEAKLRQLQGQVAWKPRPAFMTIRLSVTGHPATPPLFDILEILGKKTVLDRLEACCKELKTNNPIHEQ